MTTPHTYARTITQTALADTQTQTGGAHLPSDTQSAERVAYFGVEGLDAMLPQGMRYDTQMLVVGATGIGKSVLAAQFLYEGLVTGDRCIYVGCDEPLSNMREHMAGFRLGTTAYERTGQLLMLDAYGRELSNEPRVVPDPSNLDEFFLYQMQVIDEARAAGGRVRMVIDSLSTPMVINPGNAIVDFNAHRLRYLRSRQVLTLDNIVANVLDERTLVGLTHAYPLILRMSYKTIDGTLTRYIQLGKLKSGQFTANERAFTIDTRTGLVLQ